VQRRCGNYKLKTEGQPQNRLQEVSADEIGRLIQAVAHYCGISPTGSNTTTGQIRRIVAVLEDIPKGVPVTFCRVLAKKVRSDQKNLVEL